MGFVLKTIEELLSDSSVINYSYDDDDCPEEGVDVGFKDTSGIYINEYMIPHCEDNALVVPTGKPRGEYCDCRFPDGTTWVVHENMVKGIL